LPFPEFNMKSKIFAPPDVVIVSYQRSGTHFLEASLGSHPGVHVRGECVHRYQLHAANPELCARHRRDGIFTNRPGLLNTAIVMYSQLELFEELCGSIFKFQVIHLLRDAEQVARSCAQRRANRAFYGRDCKALYKVGQTLPPNRPYVVNPERLRQIIAAQQQHTKLFATHPNLLTLRYEELTGNAQVNELPKKYGQKILKFLQLDYHPLRNRLRKTGLPAPAGKRRANPVKISPTPSASPANKRRRRSGRAG
jgi:hypothetical protein